MYYMYMKWSIVEARKRLADLLRSAEEEPQPIYNRGRLVGAVVDPRTFAAFEAWRRRQERPTLGEAFSQLRKLCADEQYEPVVPQRRDRENPFLKVLDELSD
jgi:hypothetical protein